MNQNRQNKIFYAISLSLIVYITFPLLKGFVPIEGAVAISIFALGTTILYPEFFKKRIFFLWFIYVLIVLFNYFISDQQFDFKSIFFPLIILYTTIALTSYFIYKGDFKGLIKITMVGLFIAFIFSVTTIPFVINESNLIRNIAKFSEFREYNVNRIWLISYGMLHGLPFILPPIVFLIKANSGIKKTIPMVVSTVYILVIMFSDATTSIMLSISIIILALFIDHSKTIKKNIIRITIVGSILLVLINMNLILLFLESFQSLFNGLSTQLKIDEIKTLIKYGQVSGNLAGRNDLYLLSWNAFTENILFGSRSSTNIGRHSFFLDQLAAYGLLGFIPLLLIIFKHVKEVLNNLSFMRIYYLVGVFTFVIMFSLKNLFSFEMYIYAFVFLPGICFKIEELISNQNKLIINHSIIN